jgi:hypothetical protein
MMVVGIQYVQDERVTKLKEVISIENKKLRQFKEIEI